MPESYDGQADEGQDALEHALAALEPARTAEKAEGSWQVRRGQMLAGNSFVTAHNVKDTRDLRGRHQHRHGDHRHCAGLPQLRDPVYRGALRV